MSTRRWAVEKFNRHVYLGRFGAVKQSFGGVGRRFIALHPVFAGTGAGS